MASPLDALLGMPGPAGDVQRDFVASAPQPNETPSMTAGRNYQESQQRARVQRYRAEDLAKRHVPTSTDTAGNVDAVRDETGAALTQFDSRHGIAYDSTGAPRKLVYGETGGPKMVDPFAGVGITTDEKTGFRYRITPGLPWQNVDQDPDIAARNARKEQAKAVAHEASLNDAVKRADSGVLSNALKEHNQTEKALKDSYYTEPTDDLPAVKAKIKSAFDAETKANRPAIFWGGPPDEEIAAKQVEIDARHAAEQAKADRLFKLRREIPVLQQKTAAERQKAQELAYARQTLANGGQIAPAQPQNSPAPAPQDGQGASLTTPQAVPAPNGAQQAENGKNETNSQLQEAENGQLQAAAPVETPLGPDNGVGPVANFAGSAANRVLESNAGMREAGLRAGSAVLGAVGAETPAKWLAKAADDQKQQRIWKKELESGQVSSDNPYRKGGVMAGLNFGYSPLSSPATLGVTVDPGADYINPAKQHDFLTGVAHIAPDVAMMFSAPAAAVPIFLTRGATEGGVESTDETARLTKELESESDQSKRHQLTKRLAGQNALLGAAWGAGKTGLTLGAFHLAGKLSPALLPEIAAPWRRFLANTGSASALNAATDATVNALFGGHAIPQTPSEWAERGLFALGFAVLHGVNEGKLPGAVNRAYDQLGILSKAQEIAEADQSQGHPNEQVLGFIDAQRNLLEGFLDQHKPLEAKMGKLRETVDKYSGKAADEEPPDETGGTTPPDEPPPETPGSPPAGGGEAEAPRHAGEILFPSDTLAFRGGDTVRASDVTRVIRTTNDAGQAVYAIWYGENGKFVGYSDNPAWELHDKFIDPGSRAESSTTSGLPPGSAAPSLEHQSTGYTQNQASPERPLAAAFSSPAQPAPPPVSNESTRRIDEPGDKTFSSLNPTPAEAPLSPEKAGGVAVTGDTTGKSKEGESQSGQGKSQIPATGKKEPVSVPEFAALHPKSREKFNAAFEARDSDAMKALLHLGNKGLRAEFEKRVGKQLPKTESGTKMAVTSWAKGNLDEKSPSPQPSESAKAGTAEEIYDAAKATRKEAFRAFTKAQEDYRAKKIGDEEFLKASKAYDVAREAADEAETDFINAKNEEAKKPKPSTEPPPLPPLFEPERSRAPMIERYRKALSEVEKKLENEDHPNAERLKETRGKIVTKLRELEQKAAPNAKLETAEERIEPPMTAEEKSGRQRAANSQATAKAEAEVVPEPAEQIETITAAAKERKAAERMAKAPDTSPKKMKVQKEFLLSALDKAHEQATVEKTPEFAIPPVSKPKTAGDFVKIAGPSVSEDQSRAIINFVYSDGKNIVATDGRRMLVIEGKAGGTEKNPVLFEPKTMKAATKDDQGEALGAFPRWKDVLPKDATEEIRKVDTGALMKLIIQAKEITTERSNSFMLWKDEKGKIGVTASGPEVGEYRGGEADWNTAKQIASFNPDFMLDGLRAARQLGHEEVTLNHSDDMGPAQITAPGMKYVIMPMRLSAASPVERGTLAAASPVSESDRPKYEALAKFRLTEKAPTRPVEPTPDERARIERSYRELAAKGFPAVPIADVLEGAGFSLKDMHRGRGIVAQMFTSGQITSLASGDWSLSDARRQAWTVRIEDEKTLLMRMPKEGEAASAAPIGPKDFTGNVKSIASALPESAKFGEKVWIAPVYAEMYRKGLVNNREDFDAKLMKALQAGEIQLGRRDIIDPKERDMAKRSEVGDGVSTFHVIQGLDRQINSETQNPNEHSRTQGRTTKAPAEEADERGVGNSSQEGSFNPSRLRSASSEGSTAPNTGRDRGSEGETVKRLRGQIAFRYTKDRRSWRERNPDEEEGLAWVDPTSGQIVYDLPEIVKIREELGGEWGPLYERLMYSEEESHQDDFLASRQAGGIGAIQRAAYQNAPKTVQEAFEAAYGNRMPAKGKVIGSGAEIIRMLRQIQQGEGITETVFRPDLAEQMVSALQEWSLPKFLETHLRRMDAISRGTIPEAVVDPPVGKKTDRPSRLLSDRTPKRAPKREPGTLAAASPREAPISEDSDPQSDEFFSYDQNYFHEKILRRLEDHDEKAVKHFEKFVTENTKWPNTGIKLAGTGARNEMMATITPISKPGIRYQVTFFDLATDGMPRPFGDVPVVSLQDGIREAFRRKFTDAGAYPKWQYPAGVEGKPSGVAGVGPGELSKGTRSADPERVGVLAAASPKEDATSIKNAQTDVDRVAMALREVIPHTARPWEQVETEARARMEAKPKDAELLIAQLARHPRSIDDTESAMLAIKWNEAKKALADYSEDVNDAADSGDEAARLRAMTKRTLQYYDTQEMADVLKRVGTFNGQALNARKMFNLSNWTREGMMAAERAAHGGEKLTPKQIEKVEADFKRVKEMEAANEAGVKKARQARSTEAADDAVKGARAEVEQEDREWKIEFEKAQAEPPLKVSAKAAKRAQAEEEAALEEIRKMQSAGLAAASPPDENAAAKPDRLMQMYVTVGAGKLSRGTTKFSEWKAAMVKDLGEKVTPHLDRIWLASRNRLAEVNAEENAAPPAAGATPKPPSKPRGPAKEQTPADIAAKMKARLADAKDKRTQMAKLRPYVLKMVKAFIRQGITGTKEVVDAVHAELVKLEPGMTRDRANDFVGGFGDFHPLSKEAVDVRAREIKAETLEQAKINAVKKSEPLLKTGGERQAKNQATRKLTKELNEAKKEFGVVQADPEASLKSVQDSIVTRLTNEMEDVQQEIDLGKRRSRTPVDDNDERIPPLREKLKELRARRDAILGKPEMTEAQKVKVAMKATRKSLEEYTRRIKEHDFSTREGNRRDDPELNVLRAQRAAAVAEFNELRSLDEHYQAKVEGEKIEVIKQSIATLDAKLKAGEIEAKAKPAKDSVAIEALKSERAAMAQLLNDLRHPPKTAGEIEARKIQDMEKSIAALDAKLKAGDLSTAQKKRGVDSPAMQALKAERDAMQRELQEQRRAADPARQPSEIERKKLANLQASIDALDAKLKAGDLSAVPSKPSTDSTAAEALKAERAAMMKQLHELRHPAKTAAEIEQQKIEAVKAKIAELDKKLRTVDPEKGTVDSQPDAPVPKAISTERESLQMERRAMQAALDAVRAESPEGQERALLAWKRRTAQRTVELKARVAAGDFSKATRRPLFTPDREALQNAAELEKVKQEILQGREKVRLANRPLSHRALDGFAKWSRAIVLSGPITLFKLTSSAAEIMGITPVQELIGGAIGKVIPGIASRAPREGGFSLDAEMKAVSDNFTHFWNDFTGRGAGRSFGKMDIDYKYGKPDLAPPEWKDVFGRIHSALKTPARRNEFARSYVKFMRREVLAGNNPKDPVVEARVGMAAYEEAQKAIFMNKNAVVDMFKWALKRLQMPDKEGGSIHPSLTNKILESAIRSEFPIIRIPTNIVARAFQYAIGSVTGSVQAAEAYAKGIENLKPEQADRIMQNLKRGSIGLALLLYGFYHRKEIGGYYERNDKRGPNEPKFGEVKSPVKLPLIGDNIPKFLVHHPALEAMQIGATVGRVMEKHSKKTGETWGPALEGAWAGALGLLEEAPFVGTVMRDVRDSSSSKEFWGEHARSKIPVGVQQVAAWTDRKNGQPVKRTPHSFLDHPKMGIPGLRQQVKEKPRAGAGFSFF